ncbi:glycosyltransferase family 2 protein [Hyunsoonleella aestuarii]|uniref:Glycosyltransferase family 2 protein n=1 Tax=Hyunsoonleella aestuarii TaxID=912802 RepID=A0ABP8E816_9FLAO|nr:glycosyltransferase family 2 protein [Hyunsoonleella aestuarii]
MPFFSVVIPLYNKEDYIEDTLKSVMNQTFTDFEIIIVDDGSTDKSLLKINSFEDLRIKVFHQNNQGASASRNKGIELAKANIIAFLDADDIWLPNHLETLKNLVNDFPNCGLYCSRYQTKLTKRKIIKHSFSDVIADNFRGIIPDFFKASLMHRVAHTSALAIHKNIFAKYGVFDLDISSGQDLDLWVRIGAYSDVAISNEITSIYRFEIPNTLSKTSFLKKNLIDFKKFETLEQTNKSLKQFLDLYRLEYAIHYRMAGSILNSKMLLKEIRSKIPVKSKILLNLHPKLLQLLLKTKHLLKRIGFNFTIYQ